VTVKEPGIGPASDPTLDEAHLDRWLLIGVIATAVIVLSFPIYLLRERAAGGGSPEGVATPTFVGRDQSRPATKRQPGIG